MYLKSITGSIANKELEEQLAIFNSKVNVATFLGNLCIANESTGNIPVVPIGNGHSDPETVAKNNLKETWREVISNAEEALDEFEKFRDEYFAKVFQAHKEKSETDLEYVKANSEYFAQLDSDYPSGVLIKINPYILQVKSSKLDFSKVAGDLVMDYFIPKLELIERGKFKSGAMQSWQEVFYKVGSKTGEVLSPNEIGETEYPIEYKQWTEAREMFAVDDSQSYKNTIRVFDPLIEKIQKYTQATSTALTMLLVNITTPGGSKNIVKLNSTGANLKRYIGIISEVEEAIKTCLSLCDDKYEYVRKVVIASIDAKKSAGVVTSEQALAQEMAKLVF